MCKEKKKEETEREIMERLSKEYNDIDWVILYNADKLSSLTVIELSLYLFHHKITCKRKKAEKVALSKARIGSLLCNCMERHQPRQPHLRNREQRTSSTSELETNSEIDVVERVVGSSPTTLTDESSPETDLPAHYQESLITNIKIWTKAGTGWEGWLV